MLIPDLTLPRGGTVMPLMVACLVVTLGIMVMAVDVVYVYTAASEVQIAADAGALAGASVLNEHIPPTDVETHAVNAAERLVGMNPILREETPVNALIEVGHWEGKSRTFTPAGAGRIIRPNAVRVVASRDDIKLFLAPIIGIDTSRMTREAVTAVGSGVCSGIWGLEGITTFGDITTDSYDSRHGPYGEDNLHSNGDLCSGGDIVTNGSYDINGDVMFGKGHEHVDPVHSGRIWGVVADHSCGDMTTEADLEFAEFNNDNASIGLTANGEDPFLSDTGWDLQMSSDDRITLMGGTYFFDTVGLEGRAKIHVAAPTVIYVKGDAGFTGGGIVNVTMNPADLLICSVGSRLEIKAAAGFHGAIYAPETDVKLTGMKEFYGTIVSRTLEINGDTNLHVDEAIVEDLHGLKPLHPILVR